MGTGAGGRRRRRVEADDDDGDEEYVLEEEEDEDDEDLSASSAGEQGAGSDAEYEVDEEDEDDESPRPKRAVKADDRARKRKRNPAAVRSRRRRYDEDDDYSEDLEEEEEMGGHQEDLEEEEEPPRLDCATECGGRSQKEKLAPVAERSKRREEDDDMDFDPDLDEGEEEEEEDMDFDPELEGDDEEFEGEEEEESGDSHSRKIPRIKNTVRRNSASKGGKKKKSSSKVSKRKVGSAKAKKAAPTRRRRKRPVMEHYEDDEDFIVDDQIKVNRHSRKKGRFGRQVEVDCPEPVTEEDTWPAIDSDTSEFEFASSDEEPEDAELVMVEPVRVRARKGRKKRAFGSSSSSGSEFHVSDEELGDVMEEQAKRKKRTFVSGSSSDSEFHVSKELGTSRETKRKKKPFVSGSSSHSEDKELGNVREEEAKRKKRIFISQSTSDSEFHISDKEFEVFGEGKPVEAQATPPVSPRRISFTRNGEDKGKEKRELVDAGKPRCGICLSEDQKMTLQGVLDCCSHFFCFACIMEWSRVESRCPLCKRRFTTITKSSKVDLRLELKNSVIMVEERDQVYQPTQEEIRRWLDPYENLVCIECNQGGDDSLMLLCDICDSSAHTYCVGLGREVPEGNWYCGGCRLSGEGSSHARSLANSSSAQLGATGPIGTFERSRSINLWQGFDLNVSPREIPRQNHPAQSRASIVGLSTPSGRLATLSRRRGWIRILLDRQRPVVSPNVGPNGVQHSGYVPRAEPGHMNFCASAESNSWQHSSSVQRTEPNHRNLDAHSGANTSLTRLDEMQNQNSYFPSVQAQINSTPCISVDGNNFQRTECVKSNVKDMCGISPH